MHRPVERLALLVTRTGTVNSTAALNQLSHVGAVVQFHPCFGASGQVGQILAGVFFGSVCAAEDFYISEKRQVERGLRQETRGQTDISISLPGLSSPLGLA